MDEKVLRQIAKALAKNTEAFYHPGDRCPMCGYDAFWGCDSEEDSAEQAYLRLVEAIGVSGEDTDERDRRENQEGGG